MPKKINYVQSLPALEYDPAAEDDRVIFFAKPDGLYSRLADGSLIGPLGDAEDSYTFTQMTPLTTWVITHNFPYKPQITTLTLSGEEVEGDITHLSNTAVQVDWAFPMTGYAVLD